jgi:hypothetical protein
MNAYFIHEKRGIQYTKYTAGRAALKQQPQLGAECHDALATEVS